MCVCCFLSHQWACQQTSHFSWIFTNLSGPQQALNLHQPLPEGSKSAQPMPSVHTPRGLRASSHIQQFTRQLLAQGCPPAPIGSQTASQLDRKCREDNMAPWKSPPGSTPAVSQRGWPAWGLPLSTRPQGPGCRQLHSPTTQSSTILSWSSGGL